MRACKAARNDVVATSGSLAHGAMPHASEAAIPHAPDALNVRPAFATSPAFAPLGPAVDQEFEEPMVN